MRMAARLEAMGTPKYASLTRRSGKRSVWTGTVFMDWAALEAPLSWSRPSRIFVNSMSDLFHEKVAVEFIERVWDVMARAPRHTFQILTKRPTRMATLSRGLPLLPNVWLGTSVENSDYLSRIDDLRRVVARRRFVSFEPLLGSVGSARLDGIDWAIVGGESGPCARPLQEEWVSEIRAACRASGAAFFFKQWGGKNKKRAGRKFEGKHWDEYPATAF
jgi:protein gp37